MSWLQKPKPELVIDNPARSVWGHAVEGRLAITAPVHWLLLSADGCGTGVQTSLALAVGLFDGFKDGLVVQLRVPIVHGELRRTVIPDHISWNALAEIGLDRVYTLVQQLLDLVLEPFTCFRVW